MRTRPIWKICAWPGPASGIASVRIVYHAGNSLEAHMVKDVLALSGIPAYVAGDYLQSGVGTLPALDLVKILVADAHFEAARGIIDDWASGDAQV